MGNFKNKLFVIKIFLFISVLLTSFSYAALDTSTNLSVTFSPQSELYGYLSELRTIIDNSNETLEIALYGLEDFEIIETLKKAVDRGVNIRILLENARQDRNEEDDTLSHYLEETGIDVKYVNKTIHHKFIVSDRSFLATGSGNWTYNGNALYDENALYTDDEELVLLYRAEFELLWENSREFGDTFPFSTGNPGSKTILERIVNNPGRDAYFTTANFRTYISSTYGPTFAKIYQSQELANKIVELINETENSISIAANYLRSRPIAEALIAKKQSNPNINIRVYLDEQEYISETYNEIQTITREEKLADATTPGEIYNILQSNFIYSYELINAGIDVRFKFYSYSWAHETSIKMHHKYAIFDNQIIATGSYNYSYNAETNSMENLLIFDDSFSSEVVSEYINNFEEIWQTGANERYYEYLIAYINSDFQYVPVLFPAMSLTHKQITVLKNDIEKNCPVILDDYFRDNRELYDYLPRDLEISYNENKQIEVITKSDEIGYTQNYTYDNNNQISSMSIITDDSLSYEEYYQYNQNNDLVELNTPEYNLKFYYDDNNILEMLDTSQGSYSWYSMENNESITTYYSTPLYSNYLRSEWNQEGLPISAIDADGRVFNWNYNEEHKLKSISSNERTIDYNFDKENRLWEICDNKDERILYHKAADNQFTIDITGTVLANLSYTFDLQENNNELLTIEIDSGHVDSGYGNQRTIEYIFNPYGNVIRTNDLSINRDVFSNNINTISCNGVLENRTYTKQDQLSTQTVRYNNQMYYQAIYQYDGFQRISQLEETILGETTLYNYSYDSAGRLTAVIKNGIIAESYIYDDFGNRISNITEDNSENYIYNDINRLLEHSWTLSDQTRKAEYTYNDSGQLLHTEYKTIKDGSQWTTKERFYDYDVFGNLNEVSWASQSQEYRYDPYDRQIARIQNGDLSSSYIYGFSERPLAELNENGRIINVFLYGDKYTPLAMQKANRYYYIISDIRGSVRLIVDCDNGEIKQQINYDSFGRILEDSNPGYSPFAYGGGLYDKRTELHRFGARDYQAEIGRWTAEDPIAFFSGDINFYAYVTNDPVNFIDPSGLTATNTGVHWNNGWRTANGKFARPLGQGRAGARAERSVWDAIERKPGWKITRGRVSVKNSQGQLRVYDGAAKSPSGRQIGLEVKSGSARRNAYQRTFDKNVSRSNPARGVGQSKGIFIRRVLVIHVPVTPS